MANYRFGNRLTLYLLTVLFVVRLVQGAHGNKGLGFFAPILCAMGTSSRFLLSFLMFLAATVFPFTVDFFLLRASPGPVWATVVAQVIPFALPFVFCMWLASATRNLARFLLGMAIASPFIFFLLFALAMQEDSGPDDLSQTQGYLAYWTCLSGLVAALTWQLIQPSRRAALAIGLSTLGGSLLVLLAWPDPLPSLIHHSYPASPSVVQLQLPPDYFKAITLQTDYFGPNDQYGWRNKIARTELNYIPKDDSKIPVIESVQARFTLSNGEAYDLLAPETSLFERTLAKVLSFQFQNEKFALDDQARRSISSNQPDLIKLSKLAPYDFSLELFRLDPTLREKLEGQTGTLTLDVTGRMVTLIKQGVFQLNQGRRFSFPNGVVILSANPSDMKDRFMDVTLRGFTYQKENSEKSQYGDTCFLYILDDPMQGNALMSSFPVNSEQIILEPWFEAPSRVFWNGSVEPDGWKPYDDSTTLFSQPLDGFNLSIFEAQKHETFKATITIPSFSIEKEPPAATPLFQVQKEESSPSLSTPLSDQMEKERSSTPSSAPSVVPIDQLDVQYSCGAALNDHDQVVGSFRVAGPGHSVCTHAFLYSNGVFKDLGTLGGSNSAASAINNSGWVVGTADPSRGRSAPFLYADGGMTDLGDSDGWGGEACGINEDGQITGNVHDEAGARAFIYSKGKMTLLGSGEDNLLGACGINILGQLAGGEGMYGSNQAIFFNHGMVVKLGTLGGSFSIARAINDKGQIVGYSSTAGDKHIDAFLYSEGTMIDLGNLNSNRSYATCINNKGDVAGQLEGNSHGSTVFIYTPQHGMQDMATLCSHCLVDAKSSKKGFTYLVGMGGINNQGDMTGCGFYWDGSHSSIRAFLYKSADNSLTHFP